MAARPGLRTWRLSYRLPGGEATPTSEGEGDRARPPSTRYLLLKATSILPPPAKRVVP